VGVNESLDVFEMSRLPARLYSCVQAQGRLFVTAAVLSMHVLRLSVLQ